MIFKYSVCLYRRLKELIVDCDIDTTMSFNIDPKAKEVSKTLCMLQCACVDSLMTSLIHVDYAIT